MAVLLTIVFLAPNPVSNTCLVLNTYYILFEEKKESKKLLFIYTEKYSAVLKFFIFLYCSLNTEYFLGQWLPSQLDTT